jgi:hypothetical protein
MSEHSSCNGTTSGLGELSREGDLQNIMKRRHTEVPQPSDSPAENRIAADVPPKAQHAPPHDECLDRAGPADPGVTAQLRALRTRGKPATPVEAAAALIELALHESNGPVEDLSRALGRLAKSVQGAVSGTRNSLTPGEREQLARELAICIESLQFHDRLTQQLTQIRNLLATLAFTNVPMDMAGRPLDGDPRNWEVLLENLRARFTSDSHRILFNLLLPGQGGRSNVPSLHANEGSIELF